jgi:hypothetical protein
MTASESPPSAAYAATGPAMTSAASAVAVTVRILRRTRTASWMLSVPAALTNGATPSRKSANTLNSGSS